MPIDRYDIGLGSKGTFVSSAPQSGPLYEVSPCVGPADHERDALRAATDSTVSLEDFDAQRGVLQTVCSADARWSTADRRADRKCPSEAPLFGLRLAGDPARRRKSGEDARLSVLGLSVPPREPGHGPPTRGKSRRPSAHGFQHLLGSAGPPRHGPRRASARELVAQPSLARYVKAELNPGPDVLTDTEIEGFIRKETRTSYHPCGTCRMGEDDAAVVDCEGRVKAVRRLKLVGASITPKEVTGSLKAPVMMMAEKIADRIKDAEPLAGSTATCDTSLA